MAFNIAVASKYNPFTFEDYVKPLEDYTKNYREHEEAVSALLTDVATVKSIVDALPESQKEEKEKFYNYYNKLESESDALRQSGYNRERAKSMTELKKLYAIEIPRISLAEQSRRAALAEYMKLRNSGKYIMDESNSPMVHTYVDYLDGNIPSYYMGMDKDELWQKAGIAAKNISSRIFQDLKTEVVTKGGHQFLRTLKQKGVNPTSIDELFANYPQFAAEFEELKLRFGIADLPASVQAQAEQVLKDGMLENLVYDQIEDLVAMPKASVVKQQQDPNAVNFIGTDSHGNLIVTKDGRQYTVDPLAPVNADGTLNIVGSGDAEDIGSRKEVVTTKPIGFDNYFNNDVTNVESTDEMDENIANSNAKVAGLYVNTIWNSTNNTIGDVYPSDITIMMDPSLNGTLITKAKKESEVDFDIAKYYKTGNTIFFNTGGGYREGYENLDRRGEWLGDNHVRGMRINDFINEVEGMGVENSKKLAAYNDVWNRANEGGAANISSLVYSKVITAVHYSWEDIEKYAPDIYKAYKNRK